jgi:hypothetical protein
MRYAIEMGYLDSAVLGILACARRGARGRVE